MPLGVEAYLPCKKVKPSTLPRVPLRVLPRVPYWLVLRRQLRVRPAHTHEGTNENTREQESVAFENRMAHEGMWAGSGHAHAIHQLMDANKQLHWELPVSCV